MIGFVGAVVVVALQFAGQCSSSNAACPNPCTSCTYQPVVGTNPDVAGWKTLFHNAAERVAGSGLPTVQTIETGSSRTRSAGKFPCRLLPAIAMTESGVAQFCSSGGKTIISFDCGFGVMQVTSGAEDYPGIQSRADINVAAGADILAAKWNGNENFGGVFGSSDPQFLESWYFATWAYNGFVYGNNPSNPDHAAGRQPFNSPGTSARRDYAYQELVWGYLQYPLSTAGALYTGAAPTYPPVCSGNIASCCTNNVCRGVPNQSGLFSVTLPVPQPAHVDPCTPSCPPSGCPPTNQRDVIVDDEDSSFRIFGDEGAIAVIDEGGFRDRFLTAVPSTPPALLARWTGTAPSSGRFAVAGYVPLSPANHPAVNVIVTSRGGARRFTLDQGGSGGAFVHLGEVELLNGQPFTVEVDPTGSGTQRIGLDAFALSWRGDGGIARDAACSTSIDCAGTNICVDGVCQAGCEVTGCSEGSGCQRATGFCVVVESGEGEGEGEGEQPIGEGEGELPFPVEGEGEDPFPVEGEGEGPFPVEGEGEDPVKPGEGEGENGDPPPGSAPLGSSVNRGCLCGSDGDDVTPDLALATVLGVLFVRRRRR
ncbi:MAG TPA: hypothetical protein VGF99_14790 [Myxococcota bacterium]